MNNLYRPRRPCAPLEVATARRAAYSNLDALLADSDLVIVGRLTSRATERRVEGIESLTRLENDVLVERVLAGDASAGQLLPVDRLVARDPACDLIIDGHRPLAIDRPYVMALRREGDRFVLPEAPLALAEVRNGLLTSTRWPELEGLTIEVAVKRIAGRVP